MKNDYFFTKPDYAPLFLRLALAIVLFPHGAQKLLGWFGGYGFTGTMNYFTEVVGLQWIVGFLEILLEFFGPLAILSGYATRLVSFSLFFVFIGIVLTSHRDYFFMNWFGKQKGEGVEYFLLALGICASLFCSGGGKWSVDIFLQQKKSSC